MEVDPPHESRNGCVPRMLSLQLQKSPAKFSRHCQKLRLEKVSESYGTSVSTLRELSNRICAEDLILAEDQRGFEVASVSADDFRQLAALRLLLENYLWNALSRLAISTGKV